MSGCSKIFVSCDIISTDYVADVVLLYPPEFLHSVVINNFAHHEISLEVKKLLLDLIKDSVFVFFGLFRMRWPLGVSTKWLAV